MANLPAAPVVVSTFAEFIGITDCCVNSARFLPVTERPDTDNKERNTSRVDTLVWFHSISWLGLRSLDRRSPSVCMGMMDQRHGLSSDPPCNASTWCKRSVPEMRSPTLPSDYLAWVAADGSGTSEASKIERYGLLYAACEQMVASLEPAPIVVYSSQMGDDLRLLDGLRVLALACVPRDALLAAYRSWCRVAIPKTLPKTFQRGCLDPEPNAGRRFTAALPWHVSSSRHCILVAAC
jgi:hypothetical protein